MGRVIIVIEPFDFPETIYVASARLHNRIMTALDLLRRREKSVIIPLEINFPETINNSRTDYPTTDNKKETYHNSTRTRNPSTHDHPNKLTSLQRPTKTGLRAQRLP